MKKILLLSTALLSLLSTQTFAWEITKGRIISHKEWTTGNVKLSFKKSLMKKDINALKARKTSAGYTHMNVNSSIENTEGTATNPTFIEGHNYGYIANDTDSTQTFTYNFGICSTTDSHKSLCAYSYDRIELEAGGYGWNFEYPTLEVSYAKTGSYYTGAYSSFARILDGNVWGDSTQSNANGKVVIK